MSRTTYHNVAARMGRWSAHHWKTRPSAARLRRRRLRARDGRDQVNRPERGRPTESGRRIGSLDAGLERPAQGASPSRAVGSPAAIPRSLPPSKTSWRGPRSSTSSRRSTGHVSPDGRSALVEFEIRGPADKAAEKIDPVLAQVEAAQKAHPQLLRRRDRHGQRSRRDRHHRREGSGQRRNCSLPITFVILVTAFGASSPQASGCCSP